MSIFSGSRRNRSLGAGTWNHRSKEVTELRKGGQLAAAHALSLERIANSDADDYDRAAYAWCLIARERHERVILRVSSARQR